jgi:hypothetical protein
MSVRKGDQIAWTDRHGTRRKGVVLRIVRYRTGFVAAITKGDDGRQYSDVPVTRVEVLARAER